ncbi:MAG: hypothetical protein MUP69_05645 [Candidatus Atribacteria bacterium]|nr:hypothetical protein [Candidatus Atribacteria bacterium]
MVRWKERAFPQPFVFMLSRTERKFYDKQIEKDNKSIARIERAGRRTDVKEMERAEKAWRKEEKRDRKQFNKQARFPL